MLASKSAQTPAGEPMGGALSAAMTSYSIWMRCCPTVEINLVIALPSRVQLSRLLEEPLPVETMFPPLESQVTVPGASVPACQVENVQPSPPELNSLLLT